jgi:hypothetical protein
MSSIVLAGFYLGLIIWCNHKGLLSPKDFASLLAFFLGWVIALLLLLFQLEKARDDNLRLKQEETKKSFEIEAIRQINRSISSLAVILAGLGGRYLNISKEAENHLDIRGTLSSGIFAIDIIHQDISELMTGQRDFSIAIESYEIAILKFMYLVKYIDFQIEDVLELMRSYASHMRHIGDSMLTADKFPGIMERSKRISTILLDICCFLGDLRIEITNFFLGDLFSGQVHRRMPADKNHKILLDVAVKEEVEKEMGRRIQLSLGN